EVSIRGGRGARRVPGEGLGGDARQADVPAAQRHCQRGFRRRPHGREVPCRGRGGSRARGAGDAGIGGGLNRGAVAGTRGCPSPQRGGGGAGAVEDLPALAEYDERVGGEASLAASITELPDREEGQPERGEEVAQRGGARETGQVKVRRLC